MSARKEAKPRRVAKGRKTGARALKHPRHVIRARLGRFLHTFLTQTILVRVLLLFVVLWLLFSVALYVADRNSPGSMITTVYDALYWGVAAFSTAGIADTPASPLAKLIGAIWIVVGSVIFFGTIVATVTGFFMRPVQHPVNQIIETIEYNLERMEDLSVDELALLKKTSDALIVHMEKLKQKQQAADEPRH